MLNDVADNLYLRSNLYNSVTTVLTDTPTIVMRYIVFIQVNDLPNIGKSLATALTSF